MVRGIGRFWVIVLAGALHACAPLPEDPTVEAVDERTGVTVARLSRPVEFLRGPGGAPRGDPFAYLAPFETNRMGERALYLWTTVPPGEADAAAPVLVVDGVAVATPPTAVTIAELGLSASPYARPTPWNVEHVRPVDRPLLVALANASRAELIVRAADGSEQRFAAEAATLSALREFVERTGED